MNQAAGQRGQRGRKEFHTADMEMGQPSPILLPTEGDDELHSAPILSLESGEGMDYAQQLAFMEDPVTIRIEPSSERNAPKFIPVWVNGSGAEVLHDGKWVRMAYLPVGVVLTTKRKYVEVLARAKRMDVEHTDSGTTGGEPQNFLQPRNSSVAPFSVLRDENPRGHEWLTNIIGGVW